MQRTKTFKFFEVKIEDLETIYSIGKQNKLSWSLNDYKQALLNKTNKNIGITENDKTIGFILIAI